MVAGGDITKTTNVDGSYWDYEYDGRHRLTKAVRKNSGATIKATYEYAYDAGDNMTTKVEPFKDDFNDGNYTGWTVASGSWTAANNYLEPTGASWNGIRQSTTDADNEVSLSYNINNTSDANYRIYIYVRYVDANNWLAVRVKPGVIELMNAVNGTGSTLGTYTVTSSANTWYDLRIVCDGNNVQVWRTVAGQMAVKILETSNAGITTVNYVRMETSPGSSFDIDNVRILADNLSSTTTFAYSSANELTSMSDNNGTTSFTYDAWGRMTDKSHATYSATYAYRYGDKLYSVTSNFPGEGNVTYQYGGDQKRRERTVGGVLTRFRWDDAWHVLNEENSTGTLAMTYVHDPEQPIGTILSDISGTNPATGTARYYSHDNIGSTRRLRDASKTSVGQSEYEPYGGGYGESGASITHKFTGHDWDSSAQMYYAPYRYFLPNLARWATRDPLGMADGANQFVYVGDNPVDYTDLMATAKRKKRKDCEGMISDARGIEKHIEHHRDKGSTYYQQCNTLLDLIDRLTDYCGWSKEFRETTKKLMRFYQRRCNGPEKDTFRPNCDGSEKACPVCHEGEEVHSLTVIPVIELFFPVPLPGSIPVPIPVAA